jgi:tetratricopeptide (TPR) repeat protein
MIRNIPEENLNKKSLKNQINYCLDILKDEPKNLAVRESLLRSLFFLGRFDDAFEECTNLLAISPQNPMVYYLLGAIYRLRDNYPEGEKNYRKAIEYDAGFSQAHVDLGVILLSQKRIEDGIQEIRSGIVLDPSYWRAHYNLSIAYNTQLKFRESFHEAKLAWNVHKSERTFLNLIISYDMAYKQWSFRTAYILALVAFFYPRIYTLPFLVLAATRLSISALSSFRSNNKAYGYLVFATIVAIIIGFIIRY